MDGPSAFFEGRPDILDQEVRKDKYDFEEKWDSLQLGANLPMNIAYFVNSESVSQWGLPELDVVIRQRIAEKDLSNQSFMPVPSIIMSVPWYFMDCAPAQWTPWSHYIED